ncbi:hypothetical protein GCM10027098_29860 [Bowmanella dokdonensis]
MASTEFIHKWEAVGTANWRTSIDLSNTCHNEAAEIVLQFWNADGSLLTSKQVPINVSTTMTTDSDGHIF